MRGLIRAIAVSAVTALACGQTPGCPVTFRTSTVVSLDMSATTRTVLLKQEDGSYTGYELVVSPPYRLIRTTPNYPNLVGPCPQAPATPAGSVPGDAMVLSSG